MGVEENQSTDYKEYHEVVIEALIKAKEKEEKAEKALFRTGLFFLVILLCGVAYIFLKLSSGDSVSSYLRLLISDGIILTWLVALFISFYFFEGRSKKYEKAEKDFEELKEDIIDRSSDIWNSNQLEVKRIAQYHELKNKYDINLYHK
ncbi:DUF2663 family protein [Evansella sp. AB-P1]|uniref:DUF2663 family protein n=1 Tax=Evansella sp. AB-P1 TaxID=3037653 RepID=UPI00241CDAE7|nr:DUF2663 family protein [Evansella sp. AB-P1]MDG5787637.1 DUF2663 family protein [Evansella sp. AB-P1]